MGVGILLQYLDGHLAVLGRDHGHLLAFQRGGEGEDIAHVVVDHQHLLIGQDIAAVELFQDPAPVGRQARYQPVQEQCRLVEQPLGRPHVLDDALGGQHLERVLVGARERFRAIDDDRDFARRRVALEGLQQLDGAHVGQLAIHHHAVVALLAQRGQGLLGAGHGLDAHAGAVADQLRQGLAPGLVAIDEQQVPNLALGEALDVGQRLGQGLGRDRLDQVRVGAEAQTARPVVVGRNDFDGDVARLRVVLEVLEHHPAVDVGQVEVERDGGRLDLAGQPQGIAAALGDDALEAAVARRLEQDGGETRVVLDDQQAAVAGPQVGAVILRRRHP